MATRKDVNETIKAHILSLKENTESNKKLATALELFGKNLGTLASETGTWRKEDNENHSNEAGQRKKAIKLLEEIKKGLEVKQNGF